MAILLALITVAVYWPATRCGFINFDDDLYVTENPYVQSGLNWGAVKWAFANPVASNWHPLTVLLHELDCQLFGLQPWGHHLTDVLLHAANTTLVFLLLRCLTGALWRSAMVAALFGWHPVHVESVAWVAEGKDVLSAFFGLSALLFYVRYAQKQSRVEGRGSSTETTVPALAPGLWPLDYTLTLLFFALGLMSKPMLVTWPFVILLLDWWPLRRFTIYNWRSTIFRLVFEKIPFLVLAAAVSVVTLLVQSRTSALVQMDQLPFAARGENALISCGRYLGELFWPSNLAVFYPHPGFWPMGQVVLAGGLLAGITVVCLLLRRRHPFLLIGWLWYCGTLVPVLGFVQAGEQAMADRYTYLPSIGVFILSIWGVNELARSWRYRTVALSVAGGLVVCLCLGLTRRQLAYWQDSETLFRHALAVTVNNHVAHNNLGAALNDQSQIDEAIRQFQEATRVKPGYARARNNLGVAFLKEGRFDEAIGQFQEALQLKPDFVHARRNLGTALQREGRSDEAISQFQEALRLKPDYAEGHYDLGTIFLGKGRIAEATVQFQEAIRLRRDYADAHNNLGIALGTQGQTDAAIVQFQEALRLKPGYPQAQRNLAHALDVKSASPDR